MRGGDRGWTFPLRDIKDYEEGGTERGRGYREGERGAQRERERERVGKERERGDGA